MYVPTLTVIFASIPGDIPLNLVNFYRDFSKPEWNPLYANVQSRVLWTPRQQSPKFTLLESFY